MFDENDDLDFGAWFESHKQDLLERFLAIQKVPSLRDWQQEFVSQPLEEQVNCIIQLPPGAGKTLLAQWIMLEQLGAYPAGRVLFAVPLRVLAKQLTDDVAAVLAMVNEAAHTDFRVQLAEGPGATVNLITNNVLVCTYEHAVGELRKDPNQAEQKRFVSLVIVDEIHNIAKGDRGMVIDDILFFSQMRSQFDRKRRPSVLGMSGTLPDWVCSRLIDSYPDMFRMVYTPELLGIAQGTRKKAARLMLPADKFDVNATIILVRDIVKTLLRERLEKEEPEWRRLVVFMSSVAEAELAFVMMTSDSEIRSLLQAVAESGRYAAPAIKLVNSTKALAERFGVQAKAKGPAVCESLMRAGVYIHHAQLSGARAREDENGRVPGWSDQIQEQLASKDFVAVFSTSTLSVGINLNSTQIGVLGPNTMWTIDQAEQMIGRVGRVDRDVGRSFVLIVDSPLYRAPGVSSILTPDTWFVPRVAASLEFLSSAVARGVRVSGNLDIRGFFRPANSAAISLPDEPGSGILPLARAWGLVDEAGVSPLAVLGLSLCKQDLKSLPATVFLIQIPKLKWTMVLLWAMLVCRPPPRWEKLFAKANAQRLTATDFFRPVPSSRAAALEMIGLYGDAHQAYPGDPTTTGRANADQTLAFFRHLFWAMAAKPTAWFSGDTADLVDYAISLASLLNTVSSDITPLVRTAIGLGVDITPIVTAFDRASSFALGVAVNYRGGPPPATERKLAELTPQEQADYSEQMKKAYEELLLPTEGWVE